MFICTLARPLTGSPIVSSCRTGEVWIGEMDWKLAGKLPGLLGSGGGDPHPERSSRGWENSVCYHTVILGKESRCPLGKYIVHS